MHPPEGQGEGGPGGFGLPVPYSTAHRARVGDLNALSSVHWPKSSAPPNKHQALPTHHHHHCPSCCFSMEASCSHIHHLLGTSRLKVLEILILEGGLDIDWCIILLYSSIEDVTVRLSVLAKTPGFHP